jgi:hypothetical protein
MRWGWLAWVRDVLTDLASRGDRCGQLGWGWLAWMTDMVKQAVTAELACY